MPAKKEEKEKKPKKQTELVDLEGRIAVLEEKIAKYYSLDQRITENANAIGKVRNCIGAVHK